MVYIVLFLAIIVKNSEKNTCLGRFYAEYTITASSRGFLCGTCPEPFGLTLFFQNDSWVGTLLGREERELLQPPWKNI